MKTILLALSAALLGFACLAQADSPAPDRSASPAAADEVRRAEVRVRIIGVQDDSGTVRVALFQGEDAYAANEPAARQQVEATPPAVELVFLDVPFGRYSISSFHDRNANEKLDSNFVGLPTEPYGFSLNARGRFGPPSFDDMAFEVGAGGADLEIELR